MRVRNLQGERIGRLYDLVFELEEGRIAFAVVSTGGFLGIGARLLGIPPGLLSHDREENVLVLNAAKEQLEKAPAFEENQWPDLAATEWVEEVYNYYGAGPFRLEDDSREEAALDRDGGPAVPSEVGSGNRRPSSVAGWGTLHRATAVIGMKLRTADNQPMAGVRDLVVDLEKEKVPYALVAVGGFLGIGEQLIAVPPSSLLRHSTEGRLATGMQRASYSRTAAPWRDRGKALLRDTASPIVHLFSMPLLEGWLNVGTEGR